MSYTAKVYIPFNTTALTELVNTNTPSVTATPSIIAGVFDNAWQMNDTVKASYTIPTFSASTLTIGFWLKSINPGMVTNPSTFATEALKIPICSICTFNTSANPVTATNVKFIIWEETQSDGTNKMKIEAGSGGAIYTSTSYTTGVYHYFFIKINVSGSSITMKRDFVTDGGSTTGTIVGLSSSGSLNLNNAVRGAYHYQIGRNRGIIDDLVIFDSIKSDTDMQRAASYGAISIADSTYANIEEVDQSMILDDASTIQINSVYSSRGNLYVARTDGKLLKGTKTLWESRRLFGTDKEIGELDFYTIEGSTSLQVSNDGLEIVNEIVKI